MTTVAGRTPLDIVMDSMNADIVTLLRLARLNDEIKETDVLNPGEIIFLFVQIYIHASVSGFCTRQTFACSHKDCLATIFTKY